MSALADIQLARHNIVTGSDTRLNNLTDELFRKGAKIYNGHSGNNVDKDTDLVIKSTCIKDTNPEVETAKTLGLNIISRGELLRRVMEEFPSSVAITGTHGKTTTSSLISYILERGGISPTVLVGGEMHNFGSNFKLGKGNVIVAELDESDGHFKKASVTCAVITNVEREHMEHYASWQALIDAYAEFVSRVPPRGLFVYSGEDPVLRDIAKKAKCRKISFGINGNFDVTCRNHSFAKSIEADLIMDGKPRFKATSGLIGRHNVMNILAASAIGVELGIKDDQIAESIKLFKGVKRRFETVGVISGHNIRVIEDYAHHPTEIRSVIKAAGQWSDGRIITIFQPHRYSRTRDLLHEFAKCFYESDILILTDIYSADEDEIQDVSAKDIFSALDISRFEKADFVFKKNIPEYVSRFVGENDTILILGAGDIRDIGKALIESLSKRFKDGSEISR